MLRAILFLVLVGLAAFAAAVIAEQHGDVSLVWNGWRITTSIPLFALVLGVALFAPCRSGLSCAGCGVCRAIYAGVAASAATRAVVTPSLMG